MYLSSWELNQKAAHPKHLDSIIEYLGYIPNITSRFEKLGMRTKLYRMKYNLSMEDFIHMPNINSNIVMKLERLRFCKVSKTEEKAIEKTLKQKPTYFYEVTLK